jgi:hypothetical protein
VGFRKKLTQDLTYSISRVVYLPEVHPVTKANRNNNVRYSIRPSRILSVAQLTLNRTAVNNIQGFWSLTNKHDRIIQKHQRTFTVLLAGRTSILLSILCFSFFIDIQRCFPYTPSPERRVLTHYKELTWSINHLKNPFLNRRLLLL